MSSLIHFDFASQFDFVSQVLVYECHSGSQHTLQILYLVTNTHDNA